MKWFLRDLSIFLWALALVAVTPLAVSASPLPQATDLTTIDQIKARGYIIVGVKFDAPPFGFINENGEVRGFEIDLMHEFAQRWLGNKTAIEFVQVTSGNRIDRLLSGDIDLIVATMTITPARDEQIDFSRVYFLDGQNILINTALLPTDDTDPVLIQALDTSTIAAVEGSTSINRIQQFALENSIAITVAGFEQYDQAIQPLLDGRIAGLTTDRGILEGLAQQHAELAILLDQNFSEEPYGIGVSPGDDAFIAFINQTLMAMKADGAYDEIYNRWFPNQPPFALDTYQLGGENPLAVTPTVMAAAPVTSTVTTAIFTPTARPPTETPTVSPTISATSSAMLALPTATATPLLLPTATTGPPTATEPPAAIAVIDASPADLPQSGATLRSFQSMPTVILLIALLFIGAIYRKQS